MTRTVELSAAGQSIWIDNITRDLLDKGTIASYISDLDVRGLTSNPSIFNAAVSKSAAYDEQIRSLAATGPKVEELFFSLAIDDLRRAADLFAPAHAATGGIDGWVSLEVSPLLADDTEGTIAAAKALHAEADRENLYIKIPGTPAGLPAITEAIAAGVPVNVTLLFSTTQYLAAADAYLSGLERRLAAGEDLGVSSVASLFISRWDVAANPSLPPELANTLGVAVGAQSYAAYRQLLVSDRVAGLLAAGAPIQRLLFASTGTKDPAAPDTLYVESLAAPDTINTMPDSTLLAFADHGELDGVLDEHGRAAEAAIAAASEHLDVAALAERLQLEGKESFSTAWRSLLEAVASKAGLAA
jgi:transaldolase